MKVIVAILLGQLALAYALPLDSAVRSARAAVSKSSSAVGPDGKVSSASLAAKTDDHVVPVGPPVEPENQSSGTVENPSAPISGPIDPNGPPPPASVLPSGTDGPHPVQGPVPTHHHHKGSVSFQKVAAQASMEKGTAIATAVNRRSTDTKTNIQQSVASGNVAISKTQNNKHTDGLSFQKSQSIGGKLAVATAENNGRVARDVTKNIQAVQAQGSKAIASASENKGSDFNIQKVLALGGDLAVAKASSGEGSPPPQGPSPQEA